MASDGTPQRWEHKWWRQWDVPTAGFRDSTGYMHRLPLRLEATNLFIHGLADPKKMWKDYEDELFQPILVGGKAVVSIWFNNFTDTDCGGEYLETWYNTFVTPKTEPQIELPAEAGPMAAIMNPTALVFLQKVLCGETPRNPGAGMNAIVGGREIFGFPKHPVLANIKHRYEEGRFVFECQHRGKKAVSVSSRLPEAEGVTEGIDVDVCTGPSTCIGGPRLGGTHLGMNGANQVRYGQAFKSTQYVAPWNPDVDRLSFGDDPHYAGMITQWDFVPVLKVHTPDLKAAAFKPSGWVTGEEAEEASRKHKVENGVTITAEAP